MEKNKMMNWKTPKDIPLGTILRDSWNGMSDFYEVVDTTEKSVVVQKIRWETCEPDNPDDVDPCHRCVHLVLDKKGNPVPEKGFRPGENVPTKRKMVTFKKDGGFYIKSISWNGGGVSILEDKTKKMIFYWG